MPVRSIVALVILSIFLQFSCDNSGVGEQSNGLQTSTEEGGNKPSNNPADRPKPAMSGKSKPVRCDQAISVDDIPADPVRGIVAGKELNPNSAVIRFSRIQNQISLDFSILKDPLKDQTCFLAGSQLKASAYKKTSDFNLQPGTYTFDSKKSDGQWNGMILYESENGGVPYVETPDVHGVIRIDSVKTGESDGKMFAPSGKVKGKIAICYSDEKQSWIAGSFDLPICSN